MGKFRMYAYAHMYETRNIDIYSLGDFHKKITTDTKVGSGVITGLMSIFENIKKPFPLEFIWVPNAHIKPSFTNSVKPGYDFSLDLRLQIVENGSVQTHFDVDFAQCKLQRSSRVGSKVKVTASCNFFRATAR